MNLMKHYKCTIGVIVLILIAILMPGDSVPSVGIPGIDKVIHFGMFFTLTATFNLEYLWHYKCLPHVFYAFLSIFIFAFMTEVMQLFASNRSFDLKDLLADTAGFIVASLLWKGFIYLHNKKKA